MEKTNLKIQNTSATNQAFTNTLPTLQPAEIDLLSRAFFLRHDFSLAPNQNQGIIYFFYVTGFPTKSWRSLSKEIFLSMSERKPLWQKPIASHHRPVVICHKNYFHKHPVSLASAAKVSSQSNQLFNQNQEHVFGMMYFPIGKDGIDFLNEFEIRRRIILGQYPYLQKSGTASPNAIVSLHSATNPNVFGVSVKRFIQNSAVKTNTYVLPYAPTMKRHKNDQLGTAYYIGKYNTIKAKITASPNNYI
jgi:hypothetical protein